MDLERIIHKFRSLGLFIQDVKNQKSYPNSLWEEWGYTEEDMARYGFINFVHPDDKEKVSGNLNGFASGNGEFSRIVFRIVDKWGKWHWILSSALVVEKDEDGKVLEYVGFDHDITEEMEARFRAEKALKETETLMSANAIITSHLELPHIISAVLEQAGRVISFNSASVQLLREREGIGEMEIVGGIGFPEEFEVIGLTFPLSSHTPNTRILEERKALILNNEEIDGYPDFRSFDYSHIRCWMGLPLICRGELLGMMTFDRFHDNPFYEEDLRLGQAFADQVAIAMENARLYEETKLMAITDALTGCYSRRWMFTELEKECELAYRHGHSLSLIMYDIDDFKLVNDTYGHQVGDEVLKKITALTGEILRKTDTLCRSGGEEFVIILPHVDRASAMEVSERIREKVQEESCVGGMKNSVTISLGCVEFQERDQDKIDEFLSRADRAMYRAKRHGKNQSACL